MDTDRDTNSGNSMPPSSEKRPGAVTSCSSRPSTPSDQPNKEKQPSSFGDDAKGKACETSSIPVESQGTLFSGGDVENGSKEPVNQPARVVSEDIDPNLVNWDGEFDPENPLNWSLAKKWYVTMMMSLLTFCITFSSSVFSQATKVTSEEFNVSPMVTTLATSLVVLGFGLGPLIWGPLSELYGRTRPLFVGFAIGSIFQIPVAVAQNVETVLVCRFFIGLFGCAPVAIVGGALSDIWSPVNRGIAGATFAGATFVGPIAGPIAGGFLVQSCFGWRWTAWLTLILQALFGSVALFTLPESFAPLLLQRRAQRLRNETQNMAHHAALDKEKPTMSEVVTKYLFRPIHMMIRESILSLFTIYLALVYGILYLSFFAYPISFGEVRGWKHQGVAALPFLGLLVGIILGCITVAYYTRTIFTRKVVKRGYVVPEDRLIPMIYAAPALPAGLFWFAWTSNPNVTWVPQAISGVLIGGGIMVIFLQGINYIVDVYTQYANSALAANTLIRGMSGAIFPLFAAQMFRGLGVAWAASLLAFLTLAMTPIPLLFYKFGARIRANSKFFKQENV